MHTPRRACKQIRAPPSGHLDPLLISRELLPMRQRYTRGAALLKSLRLRCQTRSQSVLIAPDPTHYLVLIVQFSDRHILCESGQFMYMRSSMLHDVLVRG